MFEAKTNYSRLKELLALDVSLILRGVLLLGQTYLDAGGDREAVGLLHAEQRMLRNR